MCALVNWLAIFEEEDVYASLPYWGLANSLNELAADSNQPNGAWWVYKWYAQMTGKKLPLTLENIEGPGAYVSFPRHITGHSVGISHFSRFLVISSFLVPDIRCVCLDL